MKHYQSGFGNVRVILLVVLAALTSIYALTRYNEFVEQTRVNGAFHLVNESKLKLNEFYVLSARLPASDAEKQSVMRNIPTAPDYISAVVVEHDAEDYDVMVKVYFDENTVGGASSSEQFIYIAGTRPGQGVPLDWTCGAQGVNSELLPRNCNG